MIQETIKFKDGKDQQLFFDPEPHKYYWKEDSNDISKEDERPSVTAISSLLSPAAPLIQWAANESANKFKELIQAGTAYDEVQILDYFNQIKFAHKKTLSDSGVIGSYVHDAIEKFIQFGDEPTFTNAEMIKSFSEFRKWYLEQKGLELIWTEKRVLSKEYGITGTLDALFKNGKGEYIIYDWKTSKSIKKKNFQAQIFLYSLCLKEMVDYNITSGVIVNCTKEGKLNIESFPLNEESIQIAKSCIDLFYFVNPKFKLNKGENNA